MYEARRIAQLLRHADPWNIEHGLRWYASAHDKAEMLANRFGLTIEQSAGIIAVLSPGVYWEQNLRDAEAICLEREQATVSTYANNKRKALAILNRQDAIEHIIGGLKVKAFYDNILYPDTSNSVTLDRHMLRVLMPNRDKREAERVFDAPKRYRALSDCIRRVAKRRGLLPHQIQAILWLQAREVSLWNTQR